MVIKVAVEASYLVFVHHDSLLGNIFGRILEDKPIIVIAQSTVLVWNADNLFVCLSPAFCCPANLNFDDFGGVLLNLGQVELLEKLAHYQ